MKMKSWLVICSVLLVMAPTVNAQKLEPGETRGTAVTHTDTSLSAGLDNADVALPSSITGDSEYFGKFSQLPDNLQGSAPLIVFQHGSSGINPKLGFDKWQQWLAESGISSIVFDGMQLDDRLKYKSPVEKDIYEKIHALRASEIDYVLKQAQSLDWVNQDKIILAGTSEGSVAVARNANKDFAGRIIFSWSCEDNYYVSAHDTAVNPDQPTLNIISAQDKYFSSKNEFIGNDNATGNCAAALAENENAEIVLIPDAPHTLINLPAARSATMGWLHKLIGD